jgi:NDP-sugar pyrophosphorylase family protein
VRHVLIKAFLIVNNHARIERNFSQQPTALTEVAGRTILEHVARHLRRSGITEIEVIARDEAGDIISACLLELRQAAAEGIDLAFVIDVSQYAEVNWEAAVAHHLQHSQRLTPIHTATNGSIRALIVTPALITDPFDPAMWQRRALPHRMGPEEYFAPLDSPRGLRQLASAALHGVCSLEINGKEIRPGIWIGEHARIEKGARLVAPVYIGRRSRVRAGAVITRGSAIEQHCLIDCGTVIEDSSVLPFTELGPGLDSRHAIVGEHAIFSLEREVAVAIADGKIIRQRPHGAVARVLGSAARLAAYLPQSIIQGLRRPQLPASASALSGACADLNMKTPKPERRPVGKFAPGLAVVRRYGNE